MMTLKEKLRPSGHFWSSLEYQLIMRNIGKKKD